MEGPHPLPEPPGPAVPGRCGRHPAQPLATGVCSDCLADRLSSVASPEILELPQGSTSAANDGKLRKTLMLLFQMDDDSSQAPSTTARPPEPEDPQPSQEASRGAKWKGGSWLRSILPRRGTRRAGTKEETTRPSVAADPAAGGDATPPQAERRASFRRSCEWMVCRDPPTTSKADQPPRHSWDGSMVGRALACSFACLDDEPSDGVTRVRHSNAEASSVGENPPAGAAESRNGGHSHSAADAGRSFRESCRGGGDAGPEMGASGVGRRRSNRWSRVWDRSITSPLKEFVIRKGDHVLDRSQSESRKETRRSGKTGNTADIDGETHPAGRSGLGSFRPPQSTQSATRSSQGAAANGDAQNFRTNRLNSREPKMGRSRSVHYASPGNFDSGMLRFYLTPMRSNRTTNRGRRRGSRLFARGLFGFV